MRGFPVVERVPLPLFEIACVFVVALTLVAMRRASAGSARSTGALLRDYATLAAAAWVGEDTCIALYRFYAYAPDWHLRLHHVPVLVPLIWPLVILSARDVVATLWPGLSRAARPLAVGALVAFDASLVEVVAVRAGLWSWSEAGHLGVPLIGVLGWGYFALGAEIALSRGRPLLAIALGPLTAHALVIVTWWGIFRWVLRGALGVASVAGVAALGALAVASVIVTRRRGAAIPLAIAAPRMIAAALFVALLLLSAPSDTSLWVHTASVAVPYLTATSWARLDRAGPPLAHAIHRGEGFAAMAHLAALASMQTRIALSYLWVFFRTKLLRWKMSTEAMSRVHRQSARRFKETAARLKGANVKVGQIASMQHHVLPREYIEELRSLRDAVTATEYAQIASVIESELGRGPFELFETFDKIPIAAASMAQVHLATLRTGEKVVVKVQHPGLERSVAIDLALMRLLFRVIALFVRRIDFRQVLSEAEEPLRRELDLHLEGEATDALGAELRPLGVIVPKVYWQYTSRRVITLEYIDGVNVDKTEQIREWNVDRRALMETYLRSFWHQAFGGGLFHADPHPGNVFCTREGRLAMLDFGMVKRLPENVRNGLQKELFGGIFNHPKLYADGLIEKGAMREPDRAKVEAWATKMFSDPKMRGMLFDHEIEEGAEVTELFGSLLNMVDGLETFETPQDNLMFMRALGIVIDVCKEVIPEVPVSQIAMPVLLPILGEFIAKNPEYAEAAMAAALQLAADATGRD